MTARAIRVMGGSALRGYGGGGCDGNPWVKSCVRVLICDSRKALLACNVGDHRAPNLQVRKTLERPELTSHDLGADRPGRAFSGADQRRSAVGDQRCSAVGEADFHRLEGEQFLAEVASELERNVSEQRIRDLIVVAPPQPAGMLRKNLSPAVRKVLRHDIEKDYVRSPMPRLERQLTKQLQKC